MHGNEETDFETLYELSASKGIAVADASVYGKHHHVEAVGNLADVLQFAQVLLLVGYRVEYLFHFKTIHLLTRNSIGQKLGIPVVQVSGMEDALTLSLYYQRHTAICAA